MRFARWIGFGLALLPALAAFVWCSFAARLPEPWLARRAVGDVDTRWSFADWLVVQHEPAHVLQRAAHLGLLEIPGVTLARAAFANAVLAVFTAVLLAACVRRAAGAGTAGRTIALAGAGLLVASPAFGADWLYGERLGRFVPPLLLLGSLLLLARDGRFWWRGLLVVALAAAVPFVHDHGALLFVALLPAVAAAARRAGTRVLAWGLGLLLVGNVAAVVSLAPAAPLALSGQGLGARLLEAPIAELAALLRATGACWLDALPGSSRDELVLGLGTWLLPALLCWRADRSPQARALRAPWWGCVAFGLSMVLWHAERHGTGMPSSAWRELLWGSFLLPVGVVGLLAARCGPVVWRVAAVALVLLAVQDWRSGLDRLRVTSAAADRFDAVWALPVWIGAERPGREVPTRTFEQLQGLAARGLLPDHGESLLLAFKSALASAPSPAHGDCVGGDAANVRGAIRSRLWPAPVTAVVIGVATEPGKFFPAGHVLPVPIATERDLAWVVALRTPTPEGARVRAFGLVARTGEVVRLGPTFVLRNGVLQAEGGP